MEERQDLKSSSKRGKAAKHKKNQSRSHAVTFDRFHIKQIVYSDLTENYTVNNSTSYKCPVCRQKCKFRGLRAHLSGHDYGINKMCPLCDACMIQKGNLVTHIINHMKNTDFSCLKCTMTFKLRTQVIHHLIKTHGVLYKCPFCRITFKSYSITQKHIDNRHRQNSANFKSKEPIKASLKKLKLARVKGKQGKCYVDGSTDLISRLASLNINNNYSTNCSECPICHQKCKEEEMDVHISNHRCDKRNSCPKCSFCTQRRDRFIAHIRSHIKNWPFKCLKCGKTFKHKKQITHHLKIAHGVQYKCPLCSMDCKDYLNTKKHIRSKHHQTSNQFYRAHLVTLNLNLNCAVDNSRLFRCPICSFKCKYLNMRAHISNHEIIKKGSCPVCKVGVTSTGSTEHIISHLKIKPFCCLQCTKHFKYKRDAIKHLRDVHNICYKCLLCGKQFKNFITANNHITLVRRTCKLEQKNPGSLSTRDHRSEKCDMSGDISVQGSNKSTMLSEKDTEHSSAVHTIRKETAVHLNKAGSSKEPLNSRICEEQKNSLEFLDDVQTDSSDDQNIEDDAQEENRGCKQQIEAGDDPSENMPSCSLLIPKTEVLSWCPITEDVTVSTEYIENITYLGISAYEFHKLHESLTLWIKPEELEDLEETRKLNAKAKANR